MWKTNHADQIMAIKDTRVHLSDHFTYGKLLRFTLPTILMMVFSSIYWIVDGFFISNYVGTSAFAGVNLIFPIIMLVACVGFIFGSGGGALVSKKLGEQKKEEANKTFSFITYVTFGVGVVLSVSFFFAIRPIAEGFAAINSVKTTPEMIDAATTYGRIMILGCCFYIMQGYFHSMFAVNETNFHGFLFTLGGGLLNMLLDYLLIGVFKCGIVGAAFASISGMVICSIGPVIYFVFRKKNLIFLGKPHPSMRDLGQTLYNGSSEFVSNISGSIVTIVFNIQLLKYIGEAGVTAYGVIGYICFIFFAIFIGYAVGITSTIGYNYGAKNKEELTNILHKSLVIMGVVGIVMILFSIVLSNPLSKLFTGGNEELQTLTMRAITIYSLCYAFVGFSMFGSSFFTGLNNGLISALISFLRTLVFQLGFVFLLPLLMGTDGIWVSIVVAEFLSMAMTILFMLILRKKYGYEMYLFRRKTK